MPDRLVTRERCPRCNSTNTTPIGYSIIDIVHECNQCEEEFETERDYENGDIYATWLKKGNVRLF